VDVDIERARELDYAQITSTVAPTATTEATANTVVTGNAVSYDGSTIILLEFFASDAAPTATASASISFWLYDGSSSIGRIARIVTAANVAAGGPVYAAVRFTPSAAAHTYSIRASVSSGTGFVNAGAGPGSGLVMPTFIRITRAV
jgi:hypothetical protein